MSELSSLEIENPVTATEGRLMLTGLLGGERPLRHLGGDLVTEFMPGWRAECLLTAFVPIYLLELVHDSGHRATWFVDGEGHRLGDNIADLQPAHLNMLRTYAEPAVLGLIRCLTTEVTPRPDASVQALLRLHPAMRRQLGELCRGPGSLAMQGADIATLEAETWFRRPGVTICIRKDALETLFQYHFQEYLTAAFRAGTLLIPNPVGPTPMRCVGSFTLDDFHFGYRFVDEEQGVTAILFVIGHHSGMACLYVPSIGISYGTAASLAWSRPFCNALPDRLYSHILDNAELIAPYLGARSTTLVAVTRGLPGVHLGHQLWNELTGFDFLNEALGGENMPRILVVSGQRNTELFGPLDVLFPSLSGKIDRSVEDAVQLSRRAYQQGLSPARLTREYVSTRLRKILLDRVKSTPDYISILASANRPDGHAWPTVMFGLRVENRTVVDLEHFVVRLLRHLSEYFPGITVVLDGHNSSGPNGGTIESHLEGIAGKSPMAVELDLVAFVRNSLAGLPIRIVDTIGHSVVASLSWSEISDGFIALWGAGLAKYRWVTNKPGFIFSSRANLTNRNDLRIYDLPTFMEAPTAVTFADPLSILDDADAPLLVEVDKGPYYANFRVDEPALFDQIVKTIAGWTPGAA